MGKSEYIGYIFSGKNVYPLNDLYCIHKHRRADLATDDSQKFPKSDQRRGDMINIGITL